MLLQKNMAVLGLVKFYYCIQWIFCGFLALNLPLYSIPYHYILIHPKVNLIIGLGDMISFNSLLDPTHHPFYSTLSIPTHVSKNWTHGLTFLILSGMIKVRGKSQRWRNAW
jgi:hypothetical protein